MGAGRGQVTAYPRQLESLIRLSEAHARMRFSPTVELEDVEEAARLHREALKQSATDPMSFEWRDAIRRSRLACMCVQACASREGASVDSRCILVCSLLCVLSFE